MAKVIELNQVRNDKLAEAFLQALLNQGMMPKGGASTLLKRLRES